jgi:hypothetical protein
MKAEFLFWSWVSVCSGAALLYTCEGWQVFCEQAARVWNESMKEKDAMTLEGITQDQQENKTVTDASLK